MTLEIHRKTKNVANYPLIMSSVGSVLDRGRSIAEQRERLLLARYLQDKYPHHRKQTNVPLGLPHPDLVAEFGRELALRMGIKMRPNIDAIVWDNKILILIEAKVIRWIDGLAKLPLYSAMIEDTPEFEQYKAWPRIMRMVIPFTQDNMLSIAKKLGVQVEQYSVPEIDDYVQNKLPYYQTADYKRKRTQLLDTQEALGVRSIDGL